MEQEFKRTDDLLEAAIAAKPFFMRLRLRTVGAVVKFATNLAAGWLEALTMKLFGGKKGTVLEKTLVIQLSNIRLLRSLGAGVFRDLVLGRGDDSQRKTYTGKNRVVILEALGRYFKDKESSPRYNDDDITFIDMARLEIDGTLSLKAEAALYDWMEGKVKTLSNLREMAAKEKEEREKAETDAAAETVKAVDAMEVPDADKKDGDS